MVFLRTLRNAATRLPMVPVDRYNPGCNRSWAGECRLNSGQLKRSWPWWKHAQGLRIAPLGSWRCLGVLCLKVRVSSFKLCPHCMKDSWTPSLSANEESLAMVSCKIDTLCLLICSSASSVWEIPRSRYTHVTGRRPMSAVVFACYFEGLRSG